MRVVLPRQGERHPLLVDASVRVVSGNSEPARIFDISAEGCQVNLRANFLEKDRTVVVRMDGLESLVGWVRWVRGRQAGIQFERPLHIAVVEHIAQSHPKSSVSFLEKEATLGR